MIQQRPFYCPAVAVRVMLSRQTFVISGVGNSNLAVQHDHDCSLARTCPHRYSEACRVLLLNR